MENYKKKEESFLPTMNLKAEAEYKKFLNSQSVLSLVREIMLEKKSLKVISVLKDSIQIEFEDRSKKNIYFSDKGLPQLCYIQLGSGFYRTGGILHSYINTYPYLTFCHVCRDALDDVLMNGGMYFNQQKAVAYILAKKLDMPFADEGYGISSTFYRKNTPLKSW